LSAVDNQRLALVVGGRGGRRRASASVQRETQSRLKDSSEPRAVSDSVTAQAMSLPADSSSASSSSSQPQTVNTDTTGHGPCTGHAHTEIDLESTMFNLRSSDCKLPDAAPCHSHSPPLSAIPHVLHQTSDELIVPTQVPGTRRT